MQTFNRDQKRALEDGDRTYQLFVNEIKKAVGGNYKKFMKKHWAFTSMPGLTKSTVIIKLLSKSGIKYFEITGKKSMRDFLSMCGNGFLIQAHIPNRKMLLLHNLLEKQCS